jgi:hypothetical protein
VTLPSDLTTIVVTGTYESINGTPLSGQVGFGISAAVQDATGKVILGIGTQYATLNPAGSFSIILPCTDNAGLSPTGFTYLVTEQVPGLGRSYNVALPHTLGSTVDLAALAPVSAPPAATAFASANTWTATQTYSGNPGLKITTGAASGDVLGSDASGNATWQSVPFPAGLAPTGLTGATAASRYAGGTASGAPVSGTFAVGDWVVDQTGKIWVCTTAGSPGAWTQISGNLPLTTLGDMLYENATPAAARLAGNTSATKNFLTQTGTGTVSAAPAWGTIALGDIPSGVALLAGATFTGYLAPAVVALTDAATISVNAAAGSDFRVTLGGNRTLGNPSSPVDGQKILFQVTQDATGSRTLAYGTAYEFGAGLGVPSLSSAPGTTDLLGFIYNAAKSKWLFIAFVNGFA